MRLGPLSYTRSGHRNIVLARWAGQESFLHAQWDVSVQDPWGRIQWLWDRPPVKRLRLTISMAQWSVRLPAILALIATQVRLQRFMPSTVAIRIRIRVLTWHLWHGGHGICLTGNT